MYEANQRQNNSQQKNGTHRLCVSVWIGGKTWARTEQTRPYQNVREQYQEVKCACMFMFRFLIIYAARRSIQWECSFFCLLCSLRGRDRERLGENRGERESEKNKHLSSNESFQYTLVFVISVLYRSWYLLGETDTKWQMQASNGTEYIEGGMLWRRRRCRFYWKRNEWIWVFFCNRIGWWHRLQFMHW